MIVECFGIHTEEDIRVRKEGERGITARIFTHDFLHTGIFHVSHISMSCEGSRRVSVRVCEAFNKWIRKFIRVQIGTRCMGKSLGKTIFIHDNFPTSQLLHPPRKDAPAHAFLCLVSSLLNFHCLLSPSSVLYFMNGSERQRPKLDEAERGKVFQGYDQGAEQWHEERNMWFHWLEGEKRSELIFLVGLGNSAGIAQKRKVQKSLRGDFYQYINTATC